MDNYKVIRGNETSPLEFTCQVNISNPNGHPAIALVIPLLNMFEPIRGPDRNDVLYTDIRYNELDADSNDTRISSVQIYPKITMNGTVIRCGVAFSGESIGPCWGEQVLIVHYVNSSILPQPTPTPTPCPTPSPIIVTKITTYTTTVTVTPSIAAPTTPMPNADTGGTHSLLFHPILFCRITNNLIYFFSSHAKRSGNFDNKNHFNKNDHMKLVKLLAAKRRCCKLQSVSP